MLSSLEALNAAGAASAGRSATFQPKVKPRARKGGRTTEAAACNAADGRVEDNVGAAGSGAEINQATSLPNGPVDSARPAVAGDGLASVEAQANDLLNSPSIFSQTADTQDQQPVATRSAIPFPPGNSAGEAALGPSQRQRLGKQPVEPPRSFPSTPVSDVENCPSSSQVPPLRVSDSATGETSKVKKKRVQNSSAPRKRRVENIEEPADPARMTMKDIIKFAEAKERKKLKEEAAKKQEQQASPASERREHREKESAVPLAPQVEIVNGQIVINEQSLQIDARTINKEDVESYRRIEESSSKLNYHTYMKKVPRDRWKSEETDLFYKAVQQFGTDFAVIQRLFPGKTRRQIKAKYKKEERDNPRRLSDIILQPRGDLAHYEELVNILKASAAEKAAAEDDYDFTWHINAARGNEEPVGTEEATPNDEDNNGDENENAEKMESEVADAETYEETDPALAMAEEEGSPKKEESPNREFEFPNSTSESKVEDKQTPFSLFAYETEMSDFPLGAYS